MSPLSQKRGEGDPVILYSLEKILPLFVLAVIISLRCLYKRQTLAIYHLSVVTSISEGKQEADCKCLNWSPTNPYLRKCKQEASCKCLAWNPPISCLSCTLTIVHFPIINCRHLLYSVRKLFHESESLEILLKHRLLGPSPGVSDSVGVKWGKLAFLTNSQGLRCCWGPGAHLEKLHSIGIAIGLYLTSSKLSHAFALN